MKISSTHHVTKKGTVKKNPPKKKFNKFVIAEDIEKYLRDAKLISNTDSVVIPEGGYDYEKDGDYLMWSGNFEVFKNDHQTISSGGKFQAQVNPSYMKEYSDDEYNLVLNFGGEELWVFE